jgi:serine/threonine-protein kinase
MKDQIRIHFREVADLPPAEREIYYQRRQVPAEVRAELESLLSFDARSGDVLGELVETAAERFLLANAPGLEGGRVGPYRLARFLGSGGTGAVYLAEKGVVVKLLRSVAEPPAVGQRQAMVRLNHPGIVRLLDAGRSGGYGYLVMEHVEGTRIDRYAAGRDRRVTLDLFLQVCEAVAHAHRYAVIHGNLKPSKILVDARGQPKVLGFGAPLGRPDAKYASPERLRGETAGVRGDVYSLGAVLKGLAGGVTPLSSRECLAAVARNAMRAAAEKRYPSVDAIRNDLPVPRS